MTSAAPAQRGVISGLLNLSRNLGLIAGASGMAAVFASLVGVAHIERAPAEAVAAAMRFTFPFAAMLISVSLMLAVCSRQAENRPADDLES
jgi:hypothetical protein